MFNVYTQYQALIESLPLSSEKIGILSPGRYSGYDSISAGTPQSGKISINVSHTQSGMRCSKDDNSLTLQRGLFITPHGVVVATEDTINIKINAAPVDPKIYLLYGSFLWQNNISGGTPFVDVQLFTGVLADDVYPVNSPATQCLLGVFHVAAGATSISQVTYTPAKVPLLGGANILQNFPELSATFAKLASYNRFLGMQANNLDIIQASLYQGKLRIPITANTLVVDLATYAGGIYGFINEVGNQVLPIGLELNIVFLNPGGGAYLSLTTSQTYGLSRFNLSPYSIMPVYNDVYKIAIKHGSIIKVAYRGLYGGNYLWDILDAPTYFNDSLFYLKGLINASGSAEPSWYRVDEEDGDGAAKFTAQFTASGLNPGLSYRINKQGQLELSGMFQQPSPVTAPDQLPVKVCNIPTNLIPFTTSTQMLSFVAQVYYNRSNPGASFSLTQVPMALHGNGDLVINPGASKIVTLNVIFPKVISYFGSGVQAPDPEPPSGE